MNEKETVNNLTPYHLNSKDLSIIKQNKKISNTETHTYYLIIVYLKKIQLCKPKRLFFD